MDVHLTDVSQGLSAFNLAGPDSREILSGLTELDCSNESFSYLDGKRAHIAGVPCLLLRIGFVGELGYELHCPGALAEHLWDAVLAAGEPHGIRPFGLEPQRVLRLQKLHILVGQDTDAESNAFEAAMPWIVKLDKEEDFIGRWALEAVQERGNENMLVGFRMTNGAVPTEGAAVVADGQARRAGDVVALLAAARPHDRDGVGAGGAGRGRHLDHARRRRAPAERAGFRPPPSTTPTRRSCADDPRVPRPRRGASSSTAAGRRCEARSSGCTVRDRGHLRRARGVAGGDRFRRRRAGGGRLPVRGGDRRPLPPRQARAPGGARDRRSDRRANWPADAALQPGRAEHRRRRLVVPRHARPGARDLASRPDPRGSAASSRRRAGDAGFASVTELTTALGSNAVVGPLARETFARATALDLRPDRFAESGFAPVSVARTAGMILRESGDRYLHLFGAGYAQYVWTVFADAAEELGGRAVGSLALEAEAGARA